MRAITLPALLLAVLLAGCDRTPVIHEPPLDWSVHAGREVRIEAELVVSGSSGLVRFGELVTSFEARLQQPTERHPPGPGADAVAGRNALHRLVLEDGREPGVSGYPDWLDAAPTAGAPLRAGSRLGPVTGIVVAHRGEYRLRPTRPVVVVEQAPRPAQPPRVEGGLRLAAMNLENLFNGDGRGGGFPTPRGATSHEAYLRQQARLVAALQALDVDVVALSEVENDGIGPDTALSQFVDALNAAGPATDWAAVAVDGPGTDAIRVALAYRSHRVEPVGAPVASDAAAFAWGSRPPLGQAFRARDGGEPWLVVTTHLKSKGGCPDAGHPHAVAGDRDRGDGQGCWNARRVAAAAAMADWLDSDPAGIGGENAVILGDLNSYAQEDPLRLLYDRGWVDALEAAGLERPHSYVFRGLAGRLDHALVRAGRADRLRGAAVWSINADEHDGFGYEHDDSVDVWRSSDHDPVLIGLEP